ncbi:type II secretion system protein GspN [Petrachloros mirabilis]
MISRFPWPVKLDVRKKALGWALIGLVSFLLFLVLTFPYGRLQARILSEITRATGWEVQAADWSRGFPVAVEWHDVSWTKPGVQSIPVSLMRVNVGVPELLMGQPAVEGLVHFPGTGQLGGGQMTGEVIASSWSFIGPLSMKGQLQQINLATIIKPYVTRGQLEADVAQEWENRGKEGIVFNGKGSWNADIKELMLERIPIGRAVLPSLAFNRITAAVTCRDTTCDLIEFKGDGPDGTVTAQGRILLQNPVHTSTLDIGVTILAGAGWATKSAGLPIPPISPGTPITVKLAGSVANPRITL